MYKDRFTGLYHTHFREYDPIHGRWLSEDPAGYRDGLNLYAAYMGVNGIDPLGLAGRNDQWIADYFVKPFIAIEKALITGTQTAIGVPFSILSGDIFAGFQSVNSLEKAKGCDFLITINGIWNNNGNAKTILADSYKQIYGRDYVKAKDFNAIAVRNITGAINNDTIPKALATGGGLDLIQITGNEFGGIDMASINVARAINKAQEVGEKNQKNGTCKGKIKIRVIAHSQGTMIFKRSLGYVNSKAKQNIHYQGFGGEAFIGGYGFKARNVKNSGDRVPYTPNNYLVMKIKNGQWITGHGTGHPWLQYKNDVIDF